ncbi:unnamed protein product [Adineta steineri]|uniref:Uncharacterized protein n=1 Tax=Adineta steineri TaxID=433720 RepID=A0A820EPU5_9BILA|nr:unnamed protein product [Adineta steineri]
MSNSNHSTSYSQYARNSTYSIETTRTHPEAFYVRSTYYDIIFVNNNTSMDILNKLLIHMNTGNQYSIDTNSDRRNNLSALIQINTIPIEEKSVVILFELNHFPDLSSISNWSSSLSSNSSLSNEQQQNMIHYATHDVLAVTYLIRPVLERWSFIKLKNRMVNEIFISFEKIQMPPPPASTTSKRIKNLNV